jgi:hypothetical protein
MDCTDPWNHSVRRMRAVQRRHGMVRAVFWGVHVRRTQWFAGAHGTLAAISPDDNGCLALSVPPARAGRSRAEFRMNVNSDAT